MFFFNDSFYRFYKVLQIEKRTGLMKLLNFAIYLDFKDKYKFSFFKKKRFF